MKTLGTPALKFRDRRFSEELDEIQNMRKSNLQQNVEYILRQLGLIEYGQTKVKQSIRDYLGLREGDGFLGVDKLKNLYSKSVRKMKEKDLCPFIITIPEHEISNRLGKLSKKKHLQSVLIGNFVVDIFYPQHRLAIEIDGDIHNREMKIRKDSHRDKSLITDHGILLTSFYNWHLHRGVHTLKEFFRNNDRIPDAQSKRLWRNIYCLTISRQLSVSELSRHLDIDMERLILKVNKVRNQGGLK